MRSSTSVTHGSHIRPPQNGTPRYTQRLLPQVLDSFAAEDPDHILGMAARSEDLTQGFLTITTSQLRHAVNWTAFWLDSQKCFSTQSTETIAYIGSQDFRYWILELASIKVGHPLLIPSTGNALPNTISLLKVTDCKVLFFSASMNKQAVALSELVPALTIIQVPTLEELVNSSAENYPYTKTWEEANDDVVLIVHTSGSTGLPKSIFYTNKTLGEMIDNQEMIPGIPGRNSSGLKLFKRKKPFFTGTPFFHLSGIAFGFLTMFGQSTAVMGRPDTPLTGKMVRNIAQAVKLDGMITVPSLLDAIVLEAGDEILPYLSGVEHIAWLGGLQSSH